MQELQWLRHTLISRLGHQGFRRGRLLKESLGLEDISNNQIWRELCLVMGLHVLV